MFGVYARIKKYLVEYKMNVSFVTAFFKIYDDANHFVKQRAERIRLFTELAHTGIKIGVFCDKENESEILEISKSASNVVVLGCIELEETAVGKMMLNEAVGLPANRNVEKDTAKYICLMNAKIEFLSMAIDLNPWNTDYYAWIDFNISHVFKNKPDTYSILSELRHKTVETDQIVIPGCWRDKCHDVDYLLNNVVWRFSGGVLLGHKTKLVEFYRVYLENLSTFLNKYGRIVWEVNFWAWLESTQNLDILWYLGNHDDRLVHFPECIFSEATS